MPIRGKCRRIGPIILFILAQSSRADFVGLFRTLAIAVWPSPLPAALAANRRIHHLAPTESAIATILALNSNPSATYLFDTARLISQNVFATIFWVETLKNISNTDISLVHQHNLLSFFTKQIQKNTKHQQNY